MADISFRLGDERFNFRVGAYITCKDEMLLEFSEFYKFYNLVGGRVKLGEDTKSAIVRELKEELGLNVKNPKLILIHEELFYWAEEKITELLFVYHLELDKRRHNLDDFKILDSKGLSTCWVNKKDVKNLDCRPSVIYKLPSLDLDVITHNVQR